jgi:hypothetical protein
MCRSGTSRIKSTNPQSAADRSGSQDAQPMAMELWTSGDSRTRTSDAEDRSPRPLWMLLEVKKTSTSLADFGCWRT